MRRATCDVRRVTCHVQRTTNNEQRTTDHGLLWPGDILYTYGLVGILLFVFRRVRPRNLIILGAVFLALQAPKLAVHTRTMAEATTGLAKLDEITRSGGALTDEQKTSQKEWRGTLEDARPTREKIQKEIDDRRQGYFHNVAAFAAVNVVLESLFAYCVVFAIWAFQLIVSPIWLAHFQFGPLEWAWRSLTYWRRQPMGVQAAEPTVAVTL